MTTDVAMEERIQATAVQLLLVEGYEEAARILLMTTFRLVEVGRTFVMGEEVECVDFIAELSGPDEVRRALGRRCDPDGIPFGDDEYEAILWALCEVTPRLETVIELDVVVEIVRPDSDWKRQHLERLAGRDVANQAPGASDDHIWRRLRFRSATEVAVAEELDRRRVLFFPGCRCVAGGVQDRRVLDPDFLICVDGKWGVLEVDGRPFPRRRTAPTSRRAIATCKVTGSW